MNKYNSVVRTNTLKSGKITRNSITISKTNEKEMKHNEINKLLKTIMKKHVSGKKFFITGLSPLGIWTLKGINDNDPILFLDEEEYLDGRVKDTSKFSTLSQITFTILE